MPAHLLYWLNTANLAGKDAEGISGMYEICEYAPTSVNKPMVVKELILVTKCTPKNRLLTLEASLRDIVIFSISSF